MNDPNAIACPVPHAIGEQILLAHGEGGRLTRRLIRSLLLESFQGTILHKLGDAAVLPRFDGCPVLTTDGFVVSPLFFPGGDIGKLAIHGTVNDLAVSGAIPRYLTLGLMIEEGLPMNTLRRVVASVRDAASEARIDIVTGDTKVVPRGAVDGLFLHTTGLGEMRPHLHLGMDQVRPGDHLIVSGTLGDHGIAILAAREQLAIETPPISDSAPLTDLVTCLLESGAAVRFLRDPTRGGVAAVLHELTEGTGLGMVLEESRIPVSDSVRGLCEILGLDPLFAANEGKLLAVVDPSQTETALAALRLHPLGRNATRIGTIQASHPPEVLVKTRLGVLRVLDEPEGAPFPRIC